MLMQKYTYKIMHSKYLITFDLWNMEPGGAVGGRFIRIFAANGTSDARRNTDGKSITGSSSPKLSSS